MKVNPFVFMLSLNYFFLFLDSSSLHAQYDDSRKYESSKEFTTQSLRPISKNELKWIERNGFDGQYYRWDNNEINLLLNKSLNQRTHARIQCGIAVLGGLFGLYMHLMTGIADTEEQNEKIQEIATSAFIASGVIMTGSIVICISAKSKVKKADKLRLSLSK